MRPRAADGTPTLVRPKQTDLPLAIDCVEVAGSANIVKENVNQSRATKTAQNNLVPTGIPIVVRLKRKSARLIRRDRETPRIQLKRHRTLDGVGATYRIPPPLSRAEQLREPTQRRCQVVVVEFESIDGRPTAFPLAPSLNTSIPKLALALALHAVTAPWTLDARSRTIGAMQPHENPGRPKETSAARLTRLLLSVIAVLVCLIAWALLLRAFG